MNEIEKRLSAWCKAARSDLDTAGLLIQESKFLHGLLFCHYAIEKELYAHVVRSSGDIPHETVEITRLLSLAHIRLGEQDLELLEDLSNYKVEVRIPVHMYNHLSEDRVTDYLKRTRELCMWLEKTL